MRSLTKLTLAALFACASMTTGIAQAADQAQKAEVAKLDCSRLPADTSNEQLTLCLQALRSEQASSQTKAEKAFADGRRSGLEEGYRAGRSYSSGYSGGYGGD